MVRSDPMGAEIPSVFGLVGLGGKLHSWRRRSFAQTLWHGPTVFGVTSLRSMLGSCQICPVSVKCSDEVDVLELFWLSSPKLGDMWDQTGVNTILVFSSVVIRLGTFVSLWLNGMTQRSGL